MDISVSVGMTTFNSERFIEAQLDSILNQSVLPNELVISDDASEDNTIDIIKRFIDQHHDIGVKIVLVENSRRQGYMKNFETVFQKTSGDVIISCDSDDVWFPQKVEKLKECFVDPSIVYAFHDATIVDENQNVKTESLYRLLFLDWDKSNEELLMRAIKRKGFPYGMTMAFRREILKQIVPFSFAYDEWIWMCALALGKVKYINEPLIYYRRHGNNASGNNGEGLLEIIRKTDLSLWFDYPQSYVDSYEDYRSRFYEYLSNAVLEELEKQIQFRKSMISVVESSRKIRRLQALLRCYRDDYYKETRGNRNAFLADCLKVIIG